MSKSTEGVVPPDQPSFSIGQQPVSAISGGLLKPPLFTFIVVNWNYGRFVGQTIDSVRGQDYPHFECLVVDNGSTDDSMETIVKHVGNDTRFSVESLPENLGQLGAAVRALKRAKGNFVCIVDSDDYLFPNFASCHIQVHLALPRSVAITSSNVVEISETGSMLTGGYSKFHESATLREAVKGLRRAGSVPRLQTISDEGYLRLHEHTATPGLSRVGWLWAPGSSNVFRRSIMSRAIIDEPDGKLMRAADWHFNNVCHLLGGTALIDVPLSAYRHHGAKVVGWLTEMEKIPHGRLAGNKSIVVLSRPSTQIGDTFSKRRRREASQVARSGAVMVEARNAGTLTAPEWRRGLRPYKGRLDEQFGLVDRRQHMLDLSAVPVQRGRRRS